MYHYMENVENRPPKITHTSSVDNWLRTHLWKPLANITGHRKRSEKYKKKEQDRRDKEMSGDVHDTQNVRNLRECRGKVVICEKEGENSADPREPPNLPWRKR